MNIQNWLESQLPAYPHREIATLELRYLVEFCTGLTLTEQRISDAPLSSTQLLQLNQLSARLLAGEPLAYLLGNQPFWDINLMVTPDTLIPRADTEAMIERVLERAKIRENPVIYDLGTGSGAIAIVLARELPQASVIGSDLSATALSVAQKNAARYHLQNLSFQQGSWLDPFPKNSADIIVSNPPYIAADDPHLTALSHEPKSALIAANEGYQDLFTIMKQAPQTLQAGGWLFLEHGYQQGLHVQYFAEKIASYHHIQTLPDRAGRDRFTEMQKV